RRRLRGRRGGAAARGPRHRRAGARTVRRGDWAAVRARDRGARRAASVARRRTAGADRDRRHIRLRHGRAAHGVGWADAGAPARNRGFRVSGPIKFDPTAQGPLAGVRVVDLSRLVAGNMISLQLGDFGADVIKVEPPQGDPLREWKEDGHSLFWKVYGRNKRSIALNLREAADMATLRTMLRASDVFIENFRPGTL